MNKNAFKSKIIVSNLIRKPFRSFGLSFLMAITVAVILSGFLFCFSLNQGLSVLSQKFGADVIVYPQGAEINDNGLLLQGDAKYLYMSNDVLEFIQTLKEVKLSTSQKFLSSLNSSCCDQKVNIVGFNPKTDFVIRPWIDKLFHNNIPENFIVAGSEIHFLDKGFNSIKLFDKHFAVNAVLEPLGNRLDQTIFTDFSTLETIKEAALLKGIQLPNSKDQISSVLIKLNKNADVKKLSEKLHSKFDGLQIRSRKDMFLNMERTINLFEILSWILGVFFFVISFVGIWVVFSLSIHERKKEFATLRVLGITKFQIKKIILDESAVLLLIGSVIGVLLGSFVFFSFKTVVADKLNLPFLSPSIFQMGVSYFLSVIISWLASLLAVYLILRKIVKKEIYLELRGE